MKCDGERREEGGERLGRGREKEAEEGGWRKRG